ncbi:G-protein coupled receptors family 1 profile domain-containing protein [Caenorhabditis elegans]|uniref:G-protein coupled receptors family 1 profile domain-containing protein n=1 Tax=Caenorhabditis elegans TaxID=6239 RepID=A0A0K3AYA0_CAEEL|nr:G-protein coupled receptors family 1 profile domain-containing protein [Caenorhabditis elegans]CTQ86943.1 G-protein coupled receptors family 1 profile domain-containing protein [Caenorhabditis elegans]|eukprot:NP_001300244.1 Uncharacterized protein CELE_Y40B10A.5 [Caenorhabditis elegans]
MSDSNEIKFSNQYTKDYDKTFIILYLVEGLFIILANLFLTIRLFTNRQLRAQKEFVIIGACLFFDVIFGITYFSAGVYRAILVIIYDRFPLVSMWDCFMTVHNQFFILIVVMAGITLVFTAIDRFICVFFPFRYLKLHIEYAYMLMFLPYLIVIPLWIPAAIGAYDNYSVKNFTMNCLMNQSLPLDLYTLYRTIRILTTIACIFIYLPIFIKMCISIYNHTKFAPGSTKNGKRLLSMTKTVAMITGSTICLFTVPDLITYFSPMISSNVLYLMNLNKGVVNLFIFLTTQKVLRDLMFPGSARKTSAMLPSRTTRTNHTIVVH